MRPLILSLMALVVAGCSGQRVAYREDLERYDTVVTGVRTELADAAKAVHAARTEREILEDRLNRQGRELQQVKDELQMALVAVEGRVGTVERRQNQVTSDLRQVASQTNERAQAVAQAQKELKALRSDINKQVASCKKALESVIAVVQAKPSTYRVKRGDTLDKIAKAHDVSVHHLKLANQLNEDTIFPEQELCIP